MLLIYPNAAPCVPYLSLNFVSPYQSNVHKIHLAIWDKGSGKSPLNIFTTEEIPPLTNSVHCQSKVDLTNLNCGALSQIIDLGRPLQEINQRRQCRNIYADKPLTNSKWTARIDRHLNKHTHVFPTESPP